MNVKKILKWLPIALCMAAQANVVDWPANGTWTPLSSAANIYADPTQDIGNNGHLYLDIVGDATYSAGYLLYRSMEGTAETEDELLIRIRLNEDKAKNPGAYQVFFETDGDDSVNWVMQLTISGQGNNVINTLEFGSASGTNRNGVVFGSTVWSSTAGYVHYAGTATGDGSNFGGDPDYFLDLAMPWATFSSQTGINSTNDPFRVMITSSQSSGQISDGDIGNSPVAPNVDFLLKDAYSATIPEPATLPLLLGVGGGIFYIRRRLLM